MPAISGISRDESFANLNNETIVCPEGSPKNTEATTYGDLLYSERKRLNFKADAVYEPARPLSFPKVSYPAADWRARVEGYVSVAMVVDKKGKVKNVEVVCATNERFQAEALKAAVKMRYHPGTWNGKAMPDIAIQPFNFKLD